MSKKELLVIDDEPILCRALAALFEDRGFHVTTVATAREALDQIERTPADVVLLDLKLPDSSGLDVLSQLKAKFPALRVIVISALADPDTIQQVFQRGASDYLAKPFDFGRCFYTAMGIEAVDLADVHPEPEALARIPAARARKGQLLPLRIVDGALQVAMADPLDLQQLEALRAELGCEVIPLAAVGPTVPEAINRWYGHDESSGAAVEDDPATTSSPAAAAMPAADDPAPLAQALLRDARARHATDLQLGVGPDGPWVRERVDGMVTDVPVPAALREQYDRVVASFKRLAGLDATERRLPQDGHFNFRVDDRVVDFRVSILPSVFGGNVCLRILDKGEIRLNIDTLGFAPHDLEKLKACARRPHGMILSTGPTGSGKTTTLYALLKLIDTPEKNIVTVEDPVEFELEGINQVNAKPEIGLTFAKALRSILRQDPDVIMVDRKSVV